MRKMLGGALGALVVCLGLAVPAAGDEPTPASKPDIALPATVVKPYRGCVPVEVAWQAYPNYIGRWDITIYPPDQMVAQSIHLNHTNAPTSGVIDDRFRVCDVDEVGLWKVGVLWGPSEFGRYESFYTSMRVVKPTPAIGLRKASRKGAVNVRIQATVTGLPMAKRKVVVYKKRSTKWVRSVVTTDSRGVVRYKSKSRPGKLKVKVCAPTTADYNRVCAAPVTVRVK